MASAFNFRMRVCALIAPSRARGHSETRLWRGHAGLHVTGWFCSQTTWAVVARMAGASTSRFENRVWTAFKVFCRLVLNFRFCARLARFAQVYCHPNSSHFCLHQDGGNWQHLLRAVNYMYRENHRLCCLWHEPEYRWWQQKETKANPS